MKLLKGLRSCAIAALFLTPTALAISWTVSPAFKTAVALWRLEGGERSLHLEGRSVQSLIDSDIGGLLIVRRLLQRYFLRYDTYITLDDIQAIDQNFLKDSDLPLLMQKACGEGKLFVWIPFRFRLPWWGDTVYEWCWKPRL